MASVPARLPELSLPASRGRRHRRVWTREGKAHIEVKTAWREGSEDLHEALTRSLEAVDAVDWASVDAVAGRVIVAFDGDRIGADDLVDIVESAEDSMGVADERFSHERVEHPGDGERIRRSAIALAADTAGLGVSLIGTVLRSTPIPVELGSVAGFVDDQPRLRHELENRVGPWAADVGLAVTAAVGQGLAQGPLGLVTDGVNRIVQLRTTLAHRQLWLAWEPRLYRSRDGMHPTPFERRPRPVPLPPGPVETYTERSSLASLLGGGATLAVTGSLRKAAAVILAGMGKPARLGREAFLGEFSRSLAGRGVLVIDPDALRRLDRIDCVVLTADLVGTGRWVVSGIAVAPGRDPQDVHARVRRLFDAERPDGKRRRQGWSLGPPGKLEFLRSEAAEELLAFGTIALCEGTDLAAVVAIAPEIDPVARQIVDTAHQIGHMVAVAGGDLELTQRLHADLALDLDSFSDDPGLTGTVRALQADGCVVALVARADPEALQAADLGLGLMSEHVPWGADVLCPGLGDCRHVIEASGIAHEVSRQSDAISLSGTSVGSLLALSSPERTAGARAVTATNTATLVAMANGTRAAVALAHHPDPAVRERVRWHELSRTSVLRYLETTPRGLTAAEAQPRLEPVGRRLPAPLALGVAIGREMANPLTPVLAGSALLSAAVGSVTDAGILLSVLGLGGLISGSQRYASEEAVRALVASSGTFAHVRRDGELVRLPETVLVPGDIVELVAGDMVPADCRILRARSLEVDEASLTGESDPVAKNTAAVFGALLGERTCMLYAGTTVLTGDGTAVVVATGSETEASANGGREERPVTGVEARLRELATISLPVAGASGAIVAGSQLLRGQPIEAALASGVSLGVAAVPESLPMLATVGQLAAARRLSARNVVVRDPRAVEALGRAEVLCIDKTGTLTKGRVELRAVWDGLTEWSIDDLEEQATNGDVQTAPDPGGSGHHQAILAAARRASPTTDGSRALPHFTDRAVITGADRLGEAIEDPEHWTRLDELAFGPERPMHATTTHIGDGILISVKGAPEYLLPKCRRVANSQGIQPMTSALAAELARGVDAMARRGLRILAVAERPIPVEDGTAGELENGFTDDHVEGLTLLGFVALADPVRPTAASAIRRLQAAGVEVVMVTGDHPSTAAGVAAELGILDGHRIATGADLESWSDSRLDHELPEVSVFARVSPADKVRIVKAYQRAGRPVAMTGDGANDANAIRLADAGIAIGQHCAPAARAAADVIITDSRIETIVEAIVEGRALWAAVRDALAILLGGNLGEIGFILASGGLTGRPSLSTRQVLLVNLLTDVVPSLAIVARPPNPLRLHELAEEGPDRSLGTKLNDAIVQRATATTLGATSAWLIGRATGGPKRASTIGLVSLIGTQLGQTLMIGGRDPLVAAAALGSAGVLAAIVQTPGVSQFFGCTPLGPMGWATALSTATGATLTSRYIPSAVDRFIPVAGRLSATLGRGVSAVVQSDA